MNPQLQGQPPDPSLAEAGLFPDLHTADEAGLVVAAMGIAWQIEPTMEGTFQLLVESKHRDAVLLELEKFQAERETTRGLKVKAPEKIPLPSLFVFGWSLFAMFLLQSQLPDHLRDAGRASSEAIVRQGEWWRAITALTLHADISHVVANIATGALFAAFILPSFGAGWTWTLILLSGAIGNLINAWTYRNEPHFSIGASTAVFGALGILVACQTAETLRSGKHLRLWQMILPIGAGLALLGHLGAGEYPTDVLAHLWGFIAGIGIGALGIVIDLKKRSSSNVQRILCVLPLIILFLSWLPAIG